MNGDGPAFPHMMVIGHKDYAGGLTIRDWFAGQALSGLMASHDWKHMYDTDSYADDAYKLADSMMAKRK